MKSIKLRPATFDDADKLLKWKNDSAMLRNSIRTTKKILREDHIAWLKHHIKDIRIITDGVVDYGDIRIDSEVSIKIDRRYRNQGVSYHALKKVVKKGMIAKIVSGNIPSIRLFLKLGFKPVKYFRGYKSYYIFEL